MKSAVWLPSTSPSTRVRWWWRVAQDQLARLAGERGRQHEGWSRSWIVSASSAERSITSPASRINDVIGIARTRAGEQETVGAGPAEQGIVASPSGGRGDRGAVGGEAAETGRCARRRGRCGGDVPRGRRRPRRGGARLPPHRREISGSALGDVPPRPPQRGDLGTALGAGYGGAGCWAGVTRLPPPRVEPHTPRPYLSGN